jgi:hypothetical protein
MNCVQLSHAHLAEVHSAGQLEKLALRGLSRVVVTTKNCGRGALANGYKDLAQRPRYPFGECLGPRSKNTASHCAKTRLINGLVAIGPSR